MPESPPLCNVNGGRLARRARTGGTARGRAGPDGGAQRAQVRPGGRGVAGAVGAPCARVLAECAGTAVRAAAARRVLACARVRTRGAAGAREGGSNRSGGVEQAVRPGGAREQRGRRDRARGVGGRREREREGEGKEKKKKKNGKKKERKRKKEGREIKREREREGRARRRRSRPRSATRGVGRVRRAGRGPNREMGQREIWMSAQFLGGIRKSSGR